MSPSLIMTHLEKPQAHNVIGSNPAGWCFLFSQTFLQNVSFNLPKYSESKVCFGVALPTVNIKKGIARRGFATIDWSTQFRRLLEFISQELGLEIKCNSSEDEMLGNDSNRHRAGGLTESVD